VIKLPLFPPQLKPDEIDLIKNLVSECVRASVVLGIVPRFVLPGRLHTLKYPLFVRIFKDGKLRGEMGKITSNTDLVEDLSAAVTGALLQDVRFPPVSREELNSLEVEIHLFFQKTNGYREGLFLKYNYYSSILFPWELTGEKEKDLQRACHKAGIFSPCWKDPATEIKYFSVDSIEKFEI